MKSGFTLDHEEKVIRRVNRHWIDLVALATITTIMIFASLAIAYGYARYQELAPVAIPGWAIVGLSGAFLALAGLMLVGGVWVYRQNYVLVTDRHLIQVEQHGLFHRQVDQVGLGRVQDVSGKRPGIVATLLDFGDVTIQSAGEQRQFVFHRVPRPQELADFCLQIHEQYVRDNPNAVD